MEDNLGNAGMPWIDEHYDSPLASTSLPDLLIEGGTAVGSLVIIIVAVFFTIVLLFVMAIFIDCRQQKLINLKAVKTRRVLNLPRVSRRRDEDLENFADKMHVGEPSSPGAIV